MSERAGIFIAYCFPEKKWFDRVYAAIKPVAGTEAILVWDERRAHNGGNSKGELAGILATHKVAMFLVSDLFIESDFVFSAKLPALLEAERADGLKICWVLASHCLFEPTGLRAEDAGNDPNQALDGLGIEKREAEIAAIMRKVAQHLGKPVPGQAAPPAVTPPALLALDAAIETRRESIAQFRRLARWLLLAALGLGVLSLPALLMGLTHFFLLAGLAVFIACQALLVQARVDFLGQCLIGMRYTRSGLADETLPTRQREPLVRKAEEIVA